VRGLIARISRWDLCEAGSSLDFEYLAAPLANYYIRCHLSIPFSSTVETIGRVDTCNEEPDALHVFLLDGDSLLMVRYDVGR
jgi:hypothetical protein